jgi:hypothetical protein
LAVGEKLDLVPQLLVNPVRKVVILEKINFLPMLVLRKLVVKHFQVFLYRTVLLLEHLLDAFDFKLVLSQRF